MNLVAHDIIIRPVVVLFGNLPQCISGLDSICGIAAASVLSFSGKLLSADDLASEHDYHADDNNSEHDCDELLHNITSQYNLPKPE